MACIICGGSETAPALSSGGFDLVKCRGCGLVYLNNPPGREELTRYYPDGYYGGGSAPGLVERIYDGLTGRLETRKFKRIRPSGSLLDVGCGDGLFLSRLSKNEKWRLFGIEISKAGHAKASGRGGMSIYNQPLEDCGFAGDFFDIVTLRHVLEHVPDPGALLGHIRRVLKPGGTLVIRVPNIGSFEASLGREEWLHIDLPRHLYQFTPETATLLLQKNGFEVTKINHFMFEYKQVLFYSFNQWLKRRFRRGRAGRGNPAAGKALFAALLPATLLVSYAFAVFGKSGTMEIRAKKR